MPLERTFQEMIDQADDILAEPAPPDAKDDAAFLWFIAANVCGRLEENTAALNVLSRFMRERFPSGQRDPSFTRSGRIK